MADPILEALRAAWLAGYGSEAATPEEAADDMAAATDRLRADLPRNAGRPDRAAILAAAGGGASQMVSAPPRKPAVSPSGDVTVVKRRESRHDAAQSM